MYRLGSKKWLEGKSIYEFWLRQWHGVDPQTGDGLWMMIVANDVIYQKIVTPVWVAMLILTFVYFVFCVQKSLVFDEKILEDYTYEIRI